MPSITWRRHQYNLYQYKSQWHLYGCLYPKVTVRFPLGPRTISFPWFHLTIFTGLSWIAYQHRLHVTPRAGQFVTATLYPAPDVTPKIGKKMANIFVGSGKVAIFAPLELETIWVTKNLAAFTYWPARPLIACIFARIPVFARIGWRLARFHVLWMWEVKMIRVPVIF